MQGQTIPLDSAGGTRLREQVGRLHAAGPAVRVSLPENVQAWAVTRGDVARRLLRDPQVSKNPRSSWPGYEPGRIAWLAAWVDAQNMFTTDGADHDRLKTLVSQSFTPRSVNALRPAVEALTDRLLDELETHGDSPVDLRAAYSYKVPTGVICDLFGVPGDQRPGMLRAMDAVLMTGSTSEEAFATMLRLTAAMKTLVETKRREPGDDMTSRLLHAADEQNGKLSEDELISTLMLVIGAGSETTVALLDSAILELLTHPGQLAAVMADDARWGDVVEETLRHSPPIVYLPLRYATADIDLGEGCLIRQGDAILMGFGGHGLDPEQHAEPHEFDIDRVGSARHLAFGYGVHYCIGAPLARMEAEVALSRLFHRFPGIALAEDSERPAPQPSFITYDVRSLPVRLRPGRA